MQTACNVLLKLKSNDLAKCAPNMMRLLEDGKCVDCVLRLLNSFDPEEFSCASGLIGWLCKIPPLLPCRKQLPCFARSSLPNWRHMHRTS
eukprot:6084614-Prymnesium_polylepis.2